MGKHNCKYSHISPMSTIKMKKKMYVMLSFTPYQIVFKCEHYIDFTTSSN